MAKRIDSIFCNQYGAKITIVNGTQYLFVAFSPSEVLVQFNTAIGTVEERRIAVRTWMCARIEAVLGAEFLPSPSSCLIREIDFDEATGAVRILGVVGASAA